MSIHCCNGSNTETRKSKCRFYPRVTWRRLAEICNQYLKKGKLVAIDGRLQIDSYEKDGEKRYSSELVADGMQMLDRGTDEPQRETISAESSPSFDLV